MAFEQIRFMVDSMTRLDTGVLLLEKLTTTGLKPGMGDVIFGDLGIYVRLPDGTLIKVAAASPSLSDRAFQVDGLPRMHLFLCDTLRQNLESGQDSSIRFFHKSANAFDVVICRGRAQTRIYRDQQLEICPECLKHYRSYYSDSSRYELFDLKRFLDQNLMDKAEDMLFDIEEESTLSLEMEEWKRISAQCKKERGYTCESCNITLKGRHAEFLQAHYSINERYHKERMQILCPVCHAKEPEHEGLRESHQYKLFRHWQAKEMVDDKSA